MAEKLSKNIREELQAGFETAFFNCANQSNLAYRTEFITNNYDRKRKVIDSIERELANCDEFQMSVAFITKSGITPLLEILKELEIKGIPGKILTTDYLCFSEPEALTKLASLKNIQLKMFRTDNETGGFHTKGYIFRKENLYHIIIGSANMTMNAISKNREWNTKIVSTGEGEIARDILSEFDQLWNDTHAEPYEKFIDAYKTAFFREKMVRQQRIIAQTDDVLVEENLHLQPNKMQVEFVKKVAEMRGSGIRKALLLSATGTGKSYASAFAARELQAKKVLFIVHREQIAKQALHSYRRIFGNTRTYGLLSGNAKEYDRDFLFATMQMMAKEEVQKELTHRHWDIVVLDECHHAGNNSYQKIMQNVTSDFWLGMTASPDTNRFDVYDIFDHNIAYEIRLQQALEEDLLCPFHYFGITELELDGEVFDDQTGVQHFSTLVSDMRVRYILEKAEYFGHSGDRVKGLIFCSRKDEAKELSAKFNLQKKENGQLYRTEVLTGEDSQDRREACCARLTAEDDKDALDYIFTVDIFNEGVDLPEINQVIMLRPTESPVVFVQQLGRGLRKSDGKEYVVILDFIGNYMNNFMIPIALSGDRSYNKDGMRRFMQEGCRILPGCSTIHFDEISRRRIYSSIDSAKTNELKLLRDSYTSLKNKLGRIPTVAEFKQYGAIDITKIFEKCGSYHAFLKKYEPDYTVSFSAKEESALEYLSRKLAAYKRVVDAALLLQLVEKQTPCNLWDLLRERYCMNLSARTEASVVWNLTNAFPKEEEQNKFRDCVWIEQKPDGYYALAEGVQKLLGNPVFREGVLEILQFALSRAREQYRERYLDTDFQLYQKYNYEDVCRLLGWKRNCNAQNIGGYFYDKDTKTMPVFINYQKAEDAIAYEDRFVNEGSLIALSKHPRKITSADADHIYKRAPEDQENRIFLFVRKNKDDNEAKEFYFLGEIHAEGEPQAIHMESTNDDAFEILYRLETPVRSDIYEYLTKD